MFFSVMRTMRSILVSCPTGAEYRWSSARAHIDGKDDELVKVNPMLERVENWTKYLTARRKKA